MLGSLQTKTKMEIRKFKPSNHRVKALVYGTSGTGKTTFGSTAPKALFASSENGLLSVADKGVDYAQINSFKDLTDLLAFLMKGGHGYETIVIDSITEINEIIKEEIEKRTKRNMQLQDWGEVQKKIKNTFRSFKSLPMHVLFIAQEKMIHDEDKIEKIVPALNGKSATTIAYDVDIVGYLMIDKAGNRKMITAQNKRLLTKDRSNKTKDAKKIDFSEWVKLIGEIKIGKEKVVVPEVDLKTKKEIKKIWDELWDYLCQFEQDTEDEKGEKKFTPDKSKEEMIKTIKKCFNLENEKDLKQPQAEQFIKRMARRLKTIKDKHGELPTY